MIQVFIECLNSTDVYIGSVYIYNAKLHRNDPN